MTNSLVRLFRPKLSLRTLFLVFIAVSCAFTIWKQNEELTQTRNKLAVLRQKGGFLEVADENIAHVVRLPNLHADQWLYRLFVPENSEVALNMAVHNVEALSYPEPRKWWPKILTSGEYILNFELREDAGGLPVFKYTIRDPESSPSNVSGKGTLTLSLKHKWVTSKWSRRNANSTTEQIRKDRTAFTNWLGNQTVQIPESEQFTLMRLMPARKLEEKAAAIKPGIMIWLSPRKTADGRK